MVELSDIESLHGRIRTVLQYLEMPVIIVNTNYKTAYINPAFEKAFAASFHDALGKDMAHYLAPSLVEAMVEAGEVVSGGADSYRFVFQEGNRYHSVGTSPITDENDRVTGIVYSFTDVTKERQLDKVKAEFISLLLNDLQTPLFNILNTFKRIENEAGPNSPQAPVIREGRDRAQEIIGHLERLLHVTDSISGELELAKSPCDLGSLLSSATGSLQEMAKREGVSLHAFPSKIPQISCDHDKLLQVIIGLISNQIQAAGRGNMVSLSTDVAPPDEPLVVYVSVAQTGRKLSEDEVPELTANLENRPPECDPTCLAVAKIIEAHDGELYLVGLENLGSAVTLCLPVK